MNTLNQSVPHIILKPKRETAVKRRHPWIFSGAIARVEGKPQSGALVAVYDQHGEFLAWGHYSPQSQIRVRLVAWNESVDPESPDFWRTRLKDALHGRRPLTAEGTTTACRLVHAESDYIPGLIVDRYAETLVVQYLSAGADRRRAQLNTLLQEVLNPATLYERSDVDVRKKEGLAPRAGLIAGTEPPAAIEIRENGLSFWVDVRHGHKTGFYLDQRDNRARLRQAIAQRVHLEDAPRVLNVFAYTGAFSVYALAAGALSVTNIDSSSAVLQEGRQNLTHNELSDNAVEDITGDAFHVLRNLRQQERTFDIIILDPPKFASTKRAVQRAARGYKDINMQAFRLLTDNGLLFTFSCSGAISDDLFQKIVFGAAHDAERNAQIVGRMTQSSDHPIALTFPEGNYLKGLICRVVG